MPGSIKFVRFLIDTVNLSLNGVTAIFEDSKGNLWVGAMGGGLNKFDRRTEQFTPFRNDPDNPRSLSSNAVNTIFEDSYGDFWVGTVVGLNGFDREQGEFTRFIKDHNDPKSLSDDNVWTIYEDESRTLWLGTQGRGLNILFEKRKNSSAMSTTQTIRTV